MAAGRREQQALRLGQETVRYIATGGFKSRATQTMGGDIRRLLGLVATHNISFGSPQATWEIVREMVRETLFDLAESIRIYSIRGARPGVSVVTAPREEYPLNPAIVLFGTNDPRFGDIGITEVNKASARVIGTFAAAFVDVIPAPYRDEAAPPGFRPQRVPPSQVEVHLPVEELREEIRGIGEQLSERVEQGLTAGFDRIAAQIPVLVRTAGAPPAPRPAPAPAPVPSPPTAAPLAGEMPTFRTQRTIFGERVAVPTRTPSLEQPLPPIAAQLEDRYRPKFLEDIVGNAASVRELRQAASTGEFKKAYLLEGPPGLGKTSAAFAAIRDYLLVRQATVGTPLFNPDFSPQSPTQGIDGSILLAFTAIDLSLAGGAGPLVARVTRFTRSLGAYPGIRRFIVLDDITRLPPGAQSELVPLTERFPNVTFFFTANTSEFLPALRSRFAYQRWRPVPDTLIEAFLLRIIQEQGYTFPDPLKAAREVLALSHVEYVPKQSHTGDVRYAVITLARLWAYYQETGEVGGISP